MRGRRVLRNSILPHFTPGAWRLHGARRLPAELALWLAVLFHAQGFAAMTQFFGLIEALVGGFQQVGGRPPILWVSGKADADGKRRRLRMQAQAVADAIGHFLRLLGVGVQEKDREFVAA